MGIEIEWNNGKLNYYTVICIENIAYIFLLGFWNCTAHAYTDVQIFNTIADI